MISLSFRDIFYILAINKEKGFLRASEKYFISQPALSKAVKHVENELGLSIFDRSSVPLKLTNEGVRIIEYFQQICSIEHDIQHYCNSVYNQEKIDIRIGAPSFFCTYILPMLISDFKARYTNVSIKLIEVNNTDLCNFLQQGILDIGISVESNILTGYSSFVLKNELIILAVPKSCKVNKKLSYMSIINKELLNPNFQHSDVPSISIKEFANENFLFLRKGNDMHQRGMKICQDAGFTPHINMELDQLMTTYHLADTGRGCTFIRSDIPYYIGISPNLVFYRINHPDVFRPVRVFYKKDKQLPTCLENFIKYLKNYNFNI